LGQHDASGFPTLYSNDTGSNNTGIGSGALAKNTTADNNTAVGIQAGYSNTTGAGITVLGAYAGYSSTASNNTFVGLSTGYLNTSGQYNIFVGSYDAAGFPTGYANTTGSYNTVLGAGALKSNTTASNNTAVGYQALYTNQGGDGTTAATNTAVGYQAGYLNQIGYNAVFIGNLAGYTNATGANNVYVGNQAGYTATASNNTFLGNAAGSSVTSGAKNTIVGQYTGNQSGLDIRTASNYIVLSDGDGNPLVSTADNQTVALEGAVPNSGTGITFPATQSASSNAHTLDDYEEGTWSAATITAVNATGVSFSEGRYTKIGNFVHVQGKFTLTVTTANTLTYVFMVLPFTPLLTTTGSLIDNVSLVAGTAQASSNGSAYAFIAASASNPAGATDWFVSYEYQV
jgi:hypothetical protein